MKLHNMVEQTFKWQKRLIFQEFRSLDVHGHFAQTVQKSKKFCEILPNKTIICVKRLIYGIISEKRLLHNSHSRRSAKLFTKSITS